MQAAMQIPDVPYLKYLTLTEQTNCQIAYTHRSILETDSDETIWIVFVNGLGLPQAFWQPCIQLLQQDLRSEDMHLSFPNIVATTYDRYAQGLSKMKGDTPPQKHDLASAANELDSVLRQLHWLHMQETSKFRILLVAHSIGVPLTRLFLNEQSPLRSSIVGAIFLDSNIANLDLVSVLPDPGSPDFDVSKLPADTNVEDLMKARHYMTRMFAPSAPNAENLDRPTLPGLLPYSDQPKILSDINAKFLLSVVAHDPETFADESLKISPRGLTEQYVEPAWQKYNLGLLSLNGQLEDGVNECVVVTAKGAGHFIQRDNPQAVSTEIYRLLSMLRSPT